MKIQLIVVSLILMFSLNRVVAQENSTAENLGKAIPPNVLNALKNATDVKKIFPVNPGERFDGQVLKADEIIFAPGATLTLTNTSAPFIVISAKRWKFADAEVTTKIMIAAAQASDGEDGDNGQDGKNGEGEINRRGNDGKPGLPGELGKNGETSSQPHIYLVAGELTSPNGEPLPGSLRLAVVASGIDGGNGGTGGNGGRGAPGKKGATSAVDCSSGPGKGGTGGSAGQGGKGGLGGDGANGSDITVVGTRSVNELFSYARIFNDGGFGGRPGRSGLPGKIGLGGIQAGPNGWCKSGQPGDAGDYPEPLDLGDGEAGKDGTKGDVTLVTVKNLSPVF